MFYIHILTEDHLCIFIIRSNNALAYMEIFEQRKSFLNVSHEIGSKQLTIVILQNIETIFYLNESGVKSEITTYTSEFS